MRGFVRDFRANIEESTYRDLYAVFGHRSAPAKTLATQVDVGQPYKAFPAKYLSISLREFTFERKLGGVSQ